MTRFSSSIAGQRGTTALVVAIVMPAILLIVAVVAQVVSWEFAQQAAQQAAANGVEAARLRGGTDADGVRTATEAARQFSSLHDVNATVAHPPTGGVEVHVTATTPGVLPGLSLSVSGTAVGPLEPQP